MIKKIYIFILFFLTMSLGSPCFALTTYGGGGPVPVPAPVGRRDCIIIERTKIIANPSNAQAECRSIAPIDPPGYYILDGTAGGPVNWAYLDETNTGASCQFALCKP